MPSTAGAGGGTAAVVPGSPVMSVTAAAAAVGAGTPPRSVGKPPRPLFASGMAEVGAAVLVGSVIFAKPAVGAMAAVGAAVGAITRVEAAAPLAVGTLLSAAAAATAAAVAAAAAAHSSASYRVFST